MAKDAPTFELKEPPPPEPLLPTDPVPLALVLMLGLFLLAGVGLFFLWRKRRVRPADPRTLRHQAYREALAALDQISAPTARGAAVQVSLILRRYLAAAAADPSLYETHEEFIARSDSLKDLTEPARAACHSGFATLAAVKYSPADAAASPTALVADARGLLETLHLGFQG